MGCFSSTMPTTPTHPKWTIESSGWEKWGSCRGTERSTNEEEEDAEPHHNPTQSGTLRHNVLRLQYIAQASETFIEMLEDDKKSGIDDDKKSGTPQNGKKSEIDDDKKPETPQINTLCERIGGPDVIRLFVKTAFDEFISEDVRIQGRFMFSGVAQHAHESALSDYIISSWGGPVDYKGRGLKAHGGLKISTGEFDAVAECFVKTMNKLKVPSEMQTEIVNWLLPKKTLVVEDQDLEL